jgi:hypothetical protein
MRTVLLVAGVLLVVAFLWQFTTYVRMGTEYGFNHLIIAIVCLVAAMGCGVAWFLTKPKESLEDISITKF